MARKVQVILEDDVDGGAADRTIEFSLDGTRYEIDLSERNFGKLQTALAPFIDKARRVGGRRRASAGTSSRANNNRNTQIREWARAQGMKVSDRGRISTEIVDAYDRAH